jgi:hypothetical protein
VIRDRLKRYLYLNHRRCPECSEFVEVGRFSCPNCTSALRPIAPRLNGPRVLMLGLCVAAALGTGTFLLVSSGDASDASSEVTELDAAANGLGVEADTLGSTFSRVLDMLHIGRRHHRRADGRKRTLTLSLPQGEKGTAGTGLPTIKLDSSHQNSSGDETDPSPARPATVPIQQAIDLPRLAGKSPVEVTRILGESMAVADSSLASQNAAAIDYRNGSVRVYYRAGIADWIVVRDLAQLHFQAEALRGVGLPVALPTHRSDDVMRWTNLGGFREVRMYAQPDGSVDHVAAYFRTIP